MTELDTCRAISFDLGEPIAGTAVASIDRWLVLQVQAAWAPKAYPGAPLSARVRAHIDRALNSAPRSRIQLVRRSGTPSGDAVLCAVACGDPASPSLHAVDLTEYADLLDIDLAAWLSDGVVPEVAEPLPSLFLVCTHGARDRCCAVWGVALYKALSAELGDVVWQSDHLGGHRFAANLLSLPAGLSLGRLEASQAPAISAALENDRLLDLSTFRGRCAYSAEAQAAEWFLRERTGELAIDAYELVSVLPTGERRWTVRFANRAGQAHEVRVAKEPLAPSQVMSCSGAPKPGWRFVGR